MPGTARDAPKEGAAKARTDSPLALGSFEALTLWAGGRDTSPMVAQAADQGSADRAPTKLAGQDGVLGAALPPRDSSPYVRKERDGEGCADPLESEGSQTKRQRRKSVSFGQTVVRHVAAYDAEAPECEDMECDGAAPKSPPEGGGAGDGEEFEEWESREDTKQVDGPSVETVCVDKMVVELFKKRDPSIVMRTLNVIVEKGTMDTIGGVRGRVDGLVDRLRRNGKVSLLPSCVVLKGHSLPVIEWMSDCASKASDLMSASRGKAAPFAASRRGSAGAPRMDQDVFAGGVAVQGA